MSVKRKSRAAPGQPSKRGRFASGGGERADGYEINARVDPMTGQRGAFPGLEDKDGHDAMFYGPAGDGLEYLRMVRAEAQTVPSMITASSAIQKKFNKTYQADSVGRDSELSGFWADEAIVAPPSEAQEDDDWDDNSLEEEQDPQEAYYSALLDRFTRLRTQFSDIALESAHCPKLEPTVDITATYQRWYGAFTRNTPKPHFIAALTKDRVIIALERLETLLTKRNMEREPLRSNIAAWSWALLAKCRDRSELAGDDVSVLRSLAKSAQRLDRTLRAGMLEEFEAQGPDVDGEEQYPSLDDSGKTERSEDTTEASDIQVGASIDSRELEAARAELLGLFNSKASGNTDPELAEQSSDSLHSALMFLDIIVTIVGELYGQRDLLDMRAAW